MAVDWEAEGLLEGLDGGAREARRELLDELSDEGFELDELREAVEQQRLVLLPVEAALGGRPRYTAEQVAERSHMSLEFLQDLWRALGMPLAEPEERAYTKADIDGARNVKEMLDSGLPDDGVLEIARAMSQSMATLAAAVGRVIGEAFMREGDSELDLARRYRRVAEEIGPQVEPTLAHVFTMQQREELRRAVVDLESVAAGEVPGSEDITVSFADLVGFTRLGERIPPDELGAVAGRLGELATEAAEPPVRLVKLIGDAAMLVSYRADPVLEATFRLLENAGREGDWFPDLRAGVASGGALRRGGDWYGPPVNLASRITAKAKAGSVLATREVRERVEGDYRWSRTRGRRLKGITSDVSLLRVRRAE